MTYVNVTDDLCDSGKFMDTLAPDVRKRATTVDATQRHAETMRRLDSLNDLVPIIGDMWTALAEARDYLSCIPETAAGGDDEAIRLAGKCGAALKRFHEWRAKP